MTMMNVLFWLFQKRGVQHKSRLTGGEGGQYIIVSAIEVAWPLVQHVQYCIVVYSVNVGAGGP